MGGFWHQLLQQPFLTHAWLGGLLASLGCGLIGPFVVIKRIGYLAGGIAHAVLGGMGIAYFLGYPPFSGALAAALTAAVLIGLITLKSKQQEDTLISALWALGMATGILFLSLSPGYHSDLMSYLFGNILMISNHHLWWMLGLDAAICLLLAVFYQPLVATVFDPEFARLRQIPANALYLLLLILIALTVVLLIQLVGLILVIALLSLPAAMAGQYSHNLRHIMAIATLLGALLTTLGLWAAYRFDLPAGACTVILVGGAYILSSLGQYWRSRN